MATTDVKELSHDDPMWSEGEQAVGKLQELLKAQKDERLQPVKVWVNRINPDRGMMYKIGRAHV